MLYLTGEDEVCIVIVNKINSLNENNINFKAYSSYNHITLKGEAYKQAMSLKNTCREIFSKLRIKESLIDEAKSKLGKMKLSNKSVTFYLSETDSAKLAMPRGDEGNLFTMQILRNKKPINTVIVNEYNQLLESYSLNNETYLSKKNYNSEFVDKTIQILYDAVDYPLLQLRLFVNKNSSSLAQPTTNAIIEQKEVNEKELSKKEKSFLPPSSKWEDFSFSEIVKQNADTYKLPTGIKRYTVVPKPTIYQIEGVNIPVRNPKRSIKPEINEEKQIVVPTKKRRGRPPKVKQEEVKKAPVLQKISETKPVKIFDLSIGKIDDKTLEKINEIKVLYKEIKAFLDTKSGPTASIICKNFPNFYKNGHLGITFKDVGFTISSNKKIQDEEVLSISNFDKTNSVNITMSGKIIESNKPWSKLISGVYKPKYKTQEQVEELMKNSSLNNLINNTHQNLVNFKDFIDTQGWRIRKNASQLKKEPGIIDESLQKKMKNILDNYKKSKEILHSMSQVSASKAIKKYPEIVKTFSSRLEFINPLGDGNNYAFDVSNNRFGEFYKLGKLNNEKELSDLYVINFDGRILKNIHKSGGFKQPFTTGKVSNIIYYSDNELKALDLKNLETILDVLNQKTSNYVEHLSDYKSNMKWSKTGKVSQKTNTEQKNTNTISLDSVKTFLDKTANEIQASADKLREITGFKSILDSIAESLKDKFDKFLEQFNK